MRTWATAALIAAGLVIPAGYVAATAAPASAAPTCANSLVCAQTTITNDGAIGGDGEYTGAGTQSIWAYDNYTRTLIINPDPTQSDCTPLGTFAANKTTDTCYLATISDTGTASTIPGRLQPNQGSNVPFQTQTIGEQTGAKVGSPTETIPFSGQATYLFYAANTNEPSSGNVPQSHDFSNAPDVTTAYATQNWYIQAFPNHAASVLYGTGLQNTWSWVYVDGCSTGPWTDSYANNNGQSALLNSSTGDGNVVGGTNCTTPASGVVSVTNPGSQSTTDTNGVSLQISATDSLSEALTYTASGLPPGLNISSSGLISGTVNTIGSYSVTVTATDTSGHTGTASFTWNVTGLTVTPPPSSSSYGNEVNVFGNGFDAYQQRVGSNVPIAVWPVSQSDPATHFLRTSEGPNYRYEYAPNGVGTGFCVSNPGDNLLVERPCNGNIWQQFSQVVVGGKTYLISAATGAYVNPNGKGSQWTGGGAPSSWGGSVLTWTPYASL